MASSLRSRCNIKERATGAKIEAAFGLLTPEVAHAKIDSVWWNSIDASRAEDADWKWESLCRDVPQNGLWETTMLATGDTVVQGALIYRIDALSILTKTHGAIYVDNLAAAPWNRGDLVAEPRFGGIGAQLLLQAVHHSHLLGLRGRVILASLPAAAGFYLHLGFTPTNETIESLTAYELEPGSARSWLIREGLVENDTQD